MAGVDAGEEGGASSARGGTDLGARRTAKKRLIEGRTCGSCLSITPANLHTVPDVPLLD